MTSLDKPNVVWILGAGFSEPLGGPLLRDLLTPGTVERLRATFSENAEFPLLHQPIAEIVELLFNYGTRFARGWPSVRSGDGEDLWPDAEAFLDVVDAPASESGWLFDVLRRAKNAVSSSRAFHDAIERANTDHVVATIAHEGEKPRPGPIVGIVRRVIAAQCCAFLKHAPIRASERWAAHRDFARHLAEEPGQHTIATFNYDFAVETLVTDATQEGDVPLATIGVDPYEATAQKKADVNLLCKLHGSADWKLGRSGSVAKSPFAALSAADEELVVATPGRSKIETIEVLKNAWEVAEDRIRRADVIIFAGYRFPKSDAHARQQILGAIRENTAPYLRLHSVLGPDLGSPENIRLHGLLAHATLGRIPIGDISDPDDATGLASGEHLYARIERHPMWVEDFLSLVPGTQLLYRPEIVRSTRLRPKGRTSRRARAR